MTIRNKKEILDDKIDLTQGDHASSNSFKSHTNLKSQLYMAITSHILNIQPLWVGVVGNHHFAVHEIFIAVIKLKSLLYIIWVIGI